MAREVCECLSSFLVMDVLAKAEALQRAGRSIIHLEIGQPDFPTPGAVKEAAVKALRDNKTGYTDSMGLLSLREAVSAYYDREYGVAVSPERILITSGTSPALMMLFAALCRSGDEVIMGDPAYACYENAVRFAGARAARVPAAEEQGFQLDPEAVGRAITPRTAAVLINSPSNPAGTLVDGETLRRLADLCAGTAGAEAGGSKAGEAGSRPRLVSDEIYHGLVYEGRAVSALEADPDACVLDGFSKRYAMTGWRLGWLIAPEDLMPALKVLQQNFAISANSVSQWAGIAALTEAGEDVRRMREEYDRRRRALLSGLSRLGFGVRSRPAGAFYVLADARHLFPAGGRPDSLRLTFDLLEKIGVAVAPGIDFGPGAEGYLRFSYANSLERIEEALQRLAAYPGLGNG